MARCCSALRTRERASITRSSSCPWCSPTSDAMRLNACAVRSNSSPAPVVGTRAAMSPAATRDGRLGERGQRPHDEPREEDPRDRRHRGDAAEQREVEASARARGRRPSPTSARRRSGAGRAGSARRPPRAAGRTRPRAARASRGRGPGPAPAPSRPCAARPPASISAAEAARRPFRVGPRCAASRSRPALSSSHTAASTPALSASALNATARLRRSSAPSPGFACTATGSSAGPAARPDPTGSRSPARAPPAAARPGRGRRPPRGSSSVRTSAGEFTANGVACDRRCPLVPEGRERALRRASSGGLATGDDLPRSDSPGRAREPAGPVLDPGRGVTGSAARAEVTSERARRAQAGTTRERPPHVDGGPRSGVAWRGVEPRPGGRPHRPGTAPFRVMPPWPDRTRTRGLDGRNQAGRRVRVQLRRPSSGAASPAPRPRSALTAPPPRHALGPTDVAVGVPRHATQSRRPRQPGRRRSHPVPQTSPSGTQTGHPASRRPGRKSPLRGFRAARNPLQEPGPLAPGMGRVDSPPSLGRDLARSAASVGPHGPAAASRPGPSDDAVRVPRPAAQDRRR